MLRLRRATMHATKADDLISTGLWQNMLLEIILAIAQPNILFQGKKLLF